MASPRKCSVVNDKAEKGVALVRFGNAGGFIKDFEILTEGQNQTYFRQKRKKGEYKLPNVQS